MQYDSGYTEYQLHRSRLRKLVRRFYLNNVLKHVKGRSVDFGCGVGNLLRRLPKGSIGLEVNAATVTYCNSLGLDVRLYHPEIDQYQFKEQTPGIFSTFVSCHVLEHLLNPDKIMRSITTACKRLQIERIIIIVPGYKGFNKDNTHRTYVDFRYLQAKQLLKIGDYELTLKSYFPFNFFWAGNVFIHNEMLLVYSRRG